MAFPAPMGQSPRYANDRGINIIGDIPIFVAMDSADVWANPSVFRLLPDGTPVAVAGVPPDYFSATGQRWGNPLYDWHAIAESNYAWWVARFRATLDMVDIARLDHFRAFAANWSVPVGEETADEGWWDRGPGRAIFDALYQKLPHANIIVEDLVLSRRMSWRCVTNSVYLAWPCCNLPSMAIPAMFTSRTMFHRMQSFTPAHTIIRQRSAGTSNYRRFTGSRCTATSVAMDRDIAWDLIRQHSIVAG